MSQKRVLGQVIWFTGLSGAGKSTLSVLLIEKLKTLGHRVCLLDGDQIRKKYTSHLGFSPEDIRKNFEVVFELSQTEQKQSDFVVVSVITPFQDLRDRAAQFFGKNYHEIFVDASLTTLLSRDVKGLYKKAIAGEISQMIGVSPEVPYERPTHSSLTIHTESESPDVSVHKIVDYLKDHL